jgi:hypothetical protein
VRGRQERCRSQQQCREPHSSVVKVVVVDATIRLLQSTSSSLLERARESGTASFMHSSKSFKS